MSEVGFVQYSVDGRQVQRRLTFACRDFARGDLNRAIGDRPVPAMLEKRQKLQGNDDGRYRVDRFYRDTAIREISVFDLRMNAFPLSIQQTRDRVQEIDKAI